MKVFTLFFITLLLCSLADAKGKKKKNKSNSAQTINVWVGSMFETEPDNYIIMGLQFYPSSVTVSPGDTVVFNFVSTEVHTVTFDLDTTIQYSLVPVNSEAFYGPFGGTTFDGQTTINSGLLGPGSNFTVLVTADPGTYRFRCIIHPQMYGFLTVVDPNLSVGPGASKVGPITQENQIDTQLDDTASAGLSLLDAAFTLLETPYDVTFPNSPTPDHVVILGIGNGVTSVYAFIPNELTISEGDSILFINMDPFVPHTVTIGNYTLPDGVGIVPETASENDYTGSDTFNSGWLWPLGNPGSLNTVTVTFTKSNTYTVYCALHVSIGMYMNLVIS